VCATGGRFVQKRAAGRIECPGCGFPLSEAVGRHAPCHALRSIPGSPNRVFDSKAVFSFFRGSPNSDDSQSPDQIDRPRSRADCSTADRGNGRHSDGDLLHPRPHAMAIAVGSLGTAGDPAGRGVAVPASPGSRFDPVAGKFGPVVGDAFQKPFAARRRSGRSKATTRDELTTRFRMLESPPLSLDAFSGKKTDRGEGRPLSGSVWCSVLRQTRYRASPLSAQSAIRPVCHCRVAPFPTATEGFQSQEEATSTDWSASPAIVTSPKRPERVHSLVRLLTHQTRFGVVPEITVIKLPWMNLP